MTAVALLAIGLLGLIVGSFLNVVIYRVPRSESLIRPGSRCPSCHTAIRPRHNIPVVSWLVLRGRCATCRAPISIQYPLVEMTTAALFVAVAWRMSSIGLISATPAWLYFTAVGVALSVIDLHHRRLPTSIILPSYAIVAVLLAASAAWEHEAWPFVRALMGSAALFAFFFAVAFAYPAGMGFGDVRLAGLTGGLLAYIGWSTLLVGAFAGFLLGAVAGIGVMAATGGGRKTALPFGPFIIAGALLALFVAKPFANWYADTVL